MDDIRYHLNRRFILIGAEVWGSEQEFGFTMIGSLSLEDMLWLADLSKTQNIEVEGAKPHELTITIKALH